MSVTCISRTLQQGSTGADVGLLETKLKSLGYYKGAIDNSFGPVLKAATIAYQGANGLAKDGVPGPVTLGKLGLWCTTPTPAMGPEAKSIMAATGKSWTNLTGFVALAETYMKYSKYYNNQKSWAQEKAAIISSFNGNPVPMNCVDDAESLDKLCREDPRYKSIIVGVWCTVDKIWHALVLVSGGEFEGKTTVINGKVYPGVIIDIAKLTSSGGNIPDHWCNLNNAVFNPSWAPVEGKLELAKST